MYRIHQISKTYSQRPSDVLLGDWFAYTVDSAVHMYGTYVDNKLSEVDKKGKPKHTLDDIIAKTEGRKGSLLDLLLASGADVIDI